MTVTSVSLGLSLRGCSKYNLTPRKRERGEMSLYKKCKKRVFFIIIIFFFFFGGGGGGGEGYCTYVL